MKTSIRHFAVWTAALSLWAGLAAAQSAEPLRIGFIGDLSGVYSDVEGRGGAVAIQMAIDDFGGTVLGQPIKLLVADHQNKADIAATRAREWIDRENAAMILGGSNSAAALAMVNITREKKRVFITSAAASPTLTNEQCSPYTVHYAYDTRAYSRATARALLEKGGKSWFFVTVDYAAGHTFEEDARKVVLENGGTVLGAVRHPLNAPDFSSAIVRAKDSKAQVLGLANAGSDAVNSVKSAKEFGLLKDMKVAALLFFLTDIHSLGLKTAEGLILTTSWDWNLNDQTRAFAERFYTKEKRMPTDAHAADYSATMAYLKAVKAANTADADKVMAQLRATPIDDFYARGYIRPDGRFVHDLYLMQVKSPAESTREWDYFKVIAKVPGEEVFTTKAESKCALWK